MLFIYIADLLFIYITITQKTAGITKKLIFETNNQANTFDLQVLTFMTITIHQIY